MNGLRYFLFFVIVFLSGLVHSQEHNFSVKSLDLPSKECYNIYQDSKGIVWFSTVRGFCKYDGKSVKVFDRTKGLYENSVYSVNEDDKGRIWILTRNNRILYIENDSIHAPRFSKEFEKLNEFSLANFAHHFQFANNYSELLVYSFKNTYLINIERGTISVVSQDKNQKNLVELKYIGGVIGQSTPNAYGVREQIDLKILDESNRELLKWENLKVSKEFLHKVIRTKEVGEFSYFSFSNILFQFNKKTKQIQKVELDGRIICIYNDRTNGIWVGVIGGGVYYFSDGNILSQPVHSLKSYSVSGVMEDSEGGIWVSTLKKGIFYCSNKNMIDYQQLEGMNMSVPSLCAFNGKVYVGTDNMKLFQVDHLEVKEIKLNLPISEFITDVLPFKNKIFVGNLFSTIQLDSKWRNGKLSNSNNTISLFPSSRLRVYNDKLFASLNNFLYQYNEQSDIFELLFKGPIKVRDFCKLDDDKWLIGDKSLVMYNQKTHKQYEIPGFSGVVSKFLKLKDGSILISTVEAGLFSYKDGKLISVNDKIQGLPIVVYDMVIDDLGVIWIGTNNGLLSLHLNTNSFRRYGMQDGLLSNDVQRLVICNDKIYLSTVEGLCSLPLSNLRRKPYVPQIFYNGASFNGEKVDLLNQPSVAYSQNNLMIKSRVINFSNRDVRLLYALIKNGDTLNREVVDGTDLVLDNLAPGSYLLEMSAVNEYLEAGNTLKYQFNIEPPFWRTWWFYLLIIVFTALLMYGVIKFYTALIRKREEEKTYFNELLANSKLMALQSQMNPHFIFNAINSIQNFILKSDVNQAYDYLTKFSQLIRLVLQNSRSKETTLKEELNILNLYITLEQLRFDNKFEFLVEVSPDVDIHSIYIPPMLIQPILENSIWHGIMPLRGERVGKIILCIEVIDDLLKISVEDNGIGRGVAPKDSIHESISMDLTQERLHIVNVLQNDSRAKIDIVDLKDSNGDACGTKVFIYVPLDREL